MRTIFQLAAGVLLGGAMLAQETAPVIAVPAAPAAPVEKAPSEARLGLSVSKPDDTTTTHVPSLPPGIGFVVSDVEKDGAAEKAGIRKLDLLWKMNDQMLVNEGQLATLLRLTSPGDEVVVSVFREGVSIDLKVKLGEGEEDNGAAIRHILNDSVIRKEDGTVRIVNIESKRAQVSNDQGSAEVFRNDDGDNVRIVDPEGEVIFEGLLSGKPEHSLVPKDWRREVCALRRGLDHAASAKAAPLRQPRPRIVPLPTQDEVKK